MSPNADLLRAIHDGDEPRALACLAAGASPEVDDEATGFSVLALAAGENLATVVRALLAAGARPDREGPEGARPLDLALGSGKLEVLRALLEAGADPNRRGPGRAPAVYLAAGDAEAVELLLRAGAIPDATTEAGETALSFAVSWGKLGSIRALLAGGANPNHVVRGDEDFEWSILCFAAQEGDVDVIAALLEGGADPTWSNQRGTTAAAVAFDHAQPGAWQALTDRAPGFSEPVGGLRGRLSVASSRRPEVTLDLQNVTQEPLGLTVDDPDSLTWVLLRDGVPVAPTSARMDVFASPRAITLAPGELVRWVVSQPGVHASGDLDLVTVIWRLPDAAGSLVIRCKWGGLSCSSPFGCGPAADALERPPDGGSTKV